MFGKVDMEAFGCLGVETIRRSVRANHVNVMLHRMDLGYVEVCSDVLFDELVNSIQSRALFVSFGYGSGRLRRCDYLADTPVGCGLTRDSRVLSFPSRHRRGPHGGDRLFRAWFASGPDTVKFRCGTVPG